MPKPHTAKHPLVFQCPLCKDLAEMRDFKTSGAGLTIDCTRCGGAIFVPAPQEAKAPTKKASKKAKSAAKAKAPKETEPAKESVAKESTAAEAPTEDTDAEAPKPLAARKAETSKERCPKCGQVREATDLNCHRCGLLFANVGKTFDPERFSKPQNAMERSALAMWEEVLEDWDDTALHERFIQFCNAQGLLEMAAHHYRRIKDDEDDPRGRVALTHLTRILEMVQAHFLANQPRGNAKATVQRGKWGLMIILLVFALYAFYIIWGKMSGNTPLQGQLP